MTNIPYTEIAADKLFPSFSDTFLTLAKGFALISDKFYLGYVLERVDLVVRDHTKSFSLPTV